MVRYGEMFICKEDGKTHPKWYIIDSYKDEVDIRWIKIQVHITIAKSPAPKKFQTQKQNKLQITSVYTPSTNLDEKKVGQVLIVKKNTTTNEHVAQHHPSLHDPTHHCLFFTA